MTVHFQQFREIAHASKRDRMSGDRLYRLVRTISVRISYGLTRIAPGLRPNHVSLAAVVLTLVALALTAFQWYGYADVWLVIVQLVLLQLAALADRVDGEIARYQKYFTQSGIYYDRLFHFFFPFALYVSVGSFFALDHGSYAVVVLACMLGALASLANMLGKLRHHIRYKIRFEGHAALIRDYVVRPAASTTTFGMQVSSSRGRLKRIASYFIFMMYDWIWAGYLVLVIISVALPELAFGVYLVHSSISLVCLLYYILVEYPRTALFTEEELKQ